MTLAQRSEEERLEVLAARSHALLADLEAINGLIERARFTYLEERLVRKPPQIEQLLERKVGRG